MPNAKKVTKSKWKVIQKGMTPDAIELSFRVNREYALSKDEYTVTPHDNFLALAIAIRDRIVERWIKTQQEYHKKNKKRVYYFSLEFLIGRLLGSNSYNLGIEKEVEEAMKDLGLDFDEIRELEVDAGLGNGGLGRLAACFLDSMATLGIPAHGYGIRYEYGIFNQKIKDGFQVEIPDQWLKDGSPWEFARPEYTTRVRYYGRVENYSDESGALRFKWVDTYDVLAVPFDTPIVGYENDTINTLRLWSARPTEEFDLEYFNSGDYEKAVHEKVLSENITKVLYPDDDNNQGKELRLKQEYFFIASSIFDIIRRFKSENEDLRKLPDKVAIQLNDTHPSLAIPELMRILLDDYRMDWETSWDITTKVFAYTNHTVMPEALEFWSVELLTKLLPRHMQIIYEINARFLDDVSEKYPADMDKLGQMSLIQEGPVKLVRMANLAIVGSHSVNGVSKLHSKLLKTKLFSDFNDFSPHKFNNKTNGITQRRWLLKSNTGLSVLISEAIGDVWERDYDKIEKLSAFKNKNAFRKRWQDIKSGNKKNLAGFIKDSNGIIVDPDSMFDVQVKRIHEYKRQLLFAFYIISQYLRIKNEPEKFIQPRTFILGGKAAPGYYMAKLIIKFLNNVAHVINHDKSLKDKIKMVFLENYRVSLAEKIFPASELSEQISTAGMEASGTGNMKFMVNGALTIGTLDGANVEMSEKLGEDNIFIFGHKAHEVDELKNRGYSPKDFISNSPILKDIFHLMETNFFSFYTPGIFDPIINSIRNYDTFLICADFESYLAKQDEISRFYLDKDGWTEKSILNVARSGYFSSDRTIKEYAKDIWKVDIVENR